MISSPRGEPISATRRKLSDESPSSFWSVDSQKLQLQRGVFRTNCMDCLGERYFSAIIAFAQTSRAQTERTWYSQRSPAAILRLFLFALVLDL